MNVLIRADATPSMGTGHVMRCVALAQAACEWGMDVVMCCRVEVSWVAERLKEERVPFRLLSGSYSPREVPGDLLKTVQEHNPDFVVLDGYHFGTDCQKTVRNAGCRLLVIDDYAHLPEYSADILLNQNLGAEKLAYGGEVARKLLGPGYALLRAEYRRVRLLAENRIESDKVHNILVTLGGGDFGKHLGGIVPHLRLPELADIRLRILAGGTPPACIEKKLANCPATLEILQRIDDMPRLLLDTDLCITAGGSTCWELCCMGVPFLTVEIAENQKELLKAMYRLGIVRPLSSDALSSLILDKELRLAARKAIMPLVTGDGANAVVSFMAG